MRDISKFKIGDIAEIFSGDKFEVLEYDFAVKGKKRQKVSSKCKNLRTGKIVNVTWHKNECFV